MNESFWDAQNVEIEGRSIFEKIELFGKIVPGEKNSIFDALGSTQNQVRRATKMSRREHGFVYCWARGIRTNFF